MIGDAVRSELQRALGRAIQFDAPTAKLTSLRVGGIADALATPPEPASHASSAEPAWEALPPYC